MMYRTRFLWSVFLVLFGFIIGQGVIVEASKDFKLISRFETSERIRDIKVEDHTACLSLGPEGILLLDISDPTQAEPVASYQNQNSIERAVIQDPWVYALDNQMLLYRLRLESNQLSLNAQLQLPGGIPSDLKLSNSDVYIAAGTGGLIIVDGSKDDYLEIKGHLQVLANEMEVDRHLLYLSGESLLIMDISAPDNPHVLSSLALIENSTVHIALGKRGLYLNYSDTGFFHNFRVINVSDPWHPQVVARFNKFDGIGYFFGGPMVMHRNSVLMRAQIPMLDNRPPVSNVLAFSYTDYYNLDLIGYIYASNNAVIASCDPYILVSDHSDKPYLHIYDLPNSTFSPAPVDPRADINQDGTVDYKDLLILQREWAKTLAP